jgi:Dolichyl-phosphate-mannose-protein mannosyltransferase
MDDVDAVQAQISRNMLASGDWVTARLNGVAYLEKAPLIYWMMAASYWVFGVHDWAARLPLALAAVFLCWGMYRFASWAADEETGFYSGMVLSTCLGLFLFTRILIPDTCLTLAITGAIWAWLYLLDPDTRPSWRWSAFLGVCLGAGLLLKGLVAVVFPVLSGLAFMAVTRQLFSVEAWRRLNFRVVIAVALLVAAPWHVLATLRNPPYFALSLHSGPGEYRGFFWFYFFNEHLLRFLNLRYPRDYNTVPRVLFWMLNVVWLFPWSVYLISNPKLSVEPVSRAGRMRLMAVCWIGVVMLFFTFSTTQEYYSMPIYPALALLAGSVLHVGGRKVIRGTCALIVICLFLCLGLSLVLLLVWRRPAAGDISQALTQHPQLYTLALGHVRDLTLGAFAYLRLPLALAAFAFGTCAVGLVVWRSDIRKSVLVVASSMAIFFQAARIALVRFDPYLGSYNLARQLRQSPPGRLIEADCYYAFSSVFFYTNRQALLWNGRNNNLAYGSYAPGAPDVFIDDQRFVSLWKGKSRWYLLAYGSEMTHIVGLVGQDRVHVAGRSADNYLLTNHPIS